MLATLTRFFPRSPFFVEPTLETLIDFKQLNCEIDIGNDMASYHDYIC